MSLLGPLPRPEIVDHKGKLLGPWATYLSLQNNLLQFLGGNGATTARPTNNLYVGMTFLDTTLGKPIWIKSINPTVWIDSTGASV